MKGSFHVGCWLIEPDLNMVSAAGKTVHLEPKVMQVLTCLADNAGKVVTKERLIRSVWPDTFVSDEVLTRAIFELRRVFGDDAKNSRFIQTIPKSGYRLTAEVTSDLKSPDPGLESTTDASNEAAVVQPRRWWRAGTMLGLAGVAALLILGLMWFRDSTARRTLSLQPLKTVPFTSFPGVEYLGTFSPDGNQIAFGWNGEKDLNAENFAIYVKQIDSEKPLRLTFGPGNDFSPVWSPDGQKIAFIRITDDVSIFLVSSLGGPERKLLTMGPIMAVVGLPSMAWSRDGRFIAYTYRAPKDRPFRLFLVSPETRAVFPLTDPPAQCAGDFNPAFSPDGRSIAFVRHSSYGTGDIYVVPAAGGESRRLTSDGAFIVGLTWTADGDEIIFSSGRAGGISSLWRIPASGGAAQRIAVEGSNFWFPSISRQGNRLTCTQVPPEDWNIYRIDISDAAASKNPPTKLIASTRNDGGPQFSPDGKKIAFHSDRSGQLEIWVSDADGTNLTQVTSLGKRAGSPCWSPDGQRIAFDVYEGSKGDVYTISPEGGPPRPIVTGISDDHWPNWSADGKWLYFASDRTGVYQVWKVPAQGGEAVQVTRQGGVLPSESPDGKYVYFNKSVFGVRGLWRVPVDGGQEARILDSFKSEAGTVLSDGIYFVGPDAKGEVAIEFFDFLTREERRVAELGKAVIIPVCPAVSPDRRHILYTQIDQVGADLVLIENFR